MKLMVDNQDSFVWKANRPKSQIKPFMNGRLRIFGLFTIDLEAHPQRTAQVYANYSCSSKISGDGLESL